MEQGFIPLSRQILDNPLWIEKPFSKGQAWVDLLLRANFKPSKFMLNGKMVKIERGQMHTSELKLAERWGWSRKKVRSYLHLLKIEQMVRLEGTANGTTLTIVNYAYYNDIGTAEDTTKDTTEGTTEGQPRIQRRDNRGYNGGTTEGTHNNKDNKDKQEKTTLNNQTSNVRARVKYSESVDNLQEISVMNFIESGGLYEFVGDKGEYKVAVNTDTGEFVKYKPLKRTEEK